IAGGCPDGHTIHFDLAIHSDNRTDWESGFHLTVEAPEISISRVIVDDAAGGDGNGRADPGETFFYRVFVINSGSEDATSLAAELTSSHGLVTVNQGEAGAALVAAGGEVELQPAFNLTVSPGCPEPEIIALYLACEADWSYAVNLQQDLPIGGFGDDMENGQGGWSHYVGTGGFVDQWHLSSEKNCTPGGATSWKQGDTGTGDYASLCDGCLETEEIPLAETTYLRFMHWMEAETSGAYPEYCYDGGLVEMSLGGGAWEQITPEDGYPYLIRTGGTPGPFPAETPVYSGEFDWSEALFVLEGYEGTARFRFRFGSDGADTREGWYVDDVEVSGTGGNMQDAPAWQPVALRPVLLQNAPNPCRPATTVAFELPREQQVRLRIFDAGGRLVRTLADGSHDAGLYRLHWDGSSDAGQAMPAGVYYYQLRTEQNTLTRSLTLLR
ncbi:MAG: T9SS type A sorting domain-containing protein, partial [Candidatus Eisenbacteria bacterium]|nr:T9SS type A sorting domain-containing protein [Candidatus Eisenbacteria bacterium]